jgi:hypothetical protein
MTQIEPQPIRGEKRASIIGPSGPERERLAPASTDHGTLPETVLRRLSQIARRKTPVVGL